MDRDLKQTKLDLPDGWVFKGTKWKGPHKTPVYVFQNIETLKTKGFSGWETSTKTTGEGKVVAAKLLREWLKPDTENT